MPCPLFRRIRQLYPYQIEEEKAGEEESTQAKALEVALQKRVKLNQSASSTVVASTLTPADGFVNITSGVFLMLYTAQFAFHSFSSHSIPSKAIFPRLVTKVTGD